MEKAKKKNRLSIFTLILICLFTLITAIYPNIQKITRAEDTTTYSTAIEDLQKDENFNAEAYPVKEKDYSLQVIQIAESVDNELFIYVYQPSAHFGNLTASSINISPYSHEDINVSNYKLQLLNNSGVFYKYKVIDFTVSDAETRYYEIPSIFRPWDAKKDNDKTPTNENSINEVVYSVAKMYLVENINEETIYRCTDMEVEVLELEDMYVGFVRYPDDMSGHPGMGFGWYEPGSDSHFIAFSTDIPIDTIYSAKVSYSTQTYNYSRSTVAGIETSKSSKFGEIIDNQEKVVNHDTVVEIEIPPYHVGKNSYSFNEIQTVEDFINTENREYVYDLGLFNVVEQIKITDEGLQDLKGKQWVLRFLNTKFEDKNSSFGVGQNTHTIEYTIVSHVTVLQLFYEIDGQSFNIGVIANKQTGDGVPDNIQESWAELKDWVKWVLGIIGVILLIVLIVACMPIITIILKAIAKVIVWICKGIWYVISAPFTIFKK